MLLHYTFFIRTTTLSGNEAKNGKKEEQFKNILRTRNFKRQKMKITVTDISLKKFTYKRMTRTPSPSFDVIEYFLGVYNFMLLRREL